MCSVIGGKSDLRTSSRVAGVSSPGDPAIESVGLESPTGGEMGMVRVPFGVVEAKRAAVRGKKDDFAGYL